MAIFYSLNAINVILTGLLKVVKGDDYITESLAMLMSISKIAETI